MGSSKRMICMVETRGINDYSRKPERHAVSQSTRNGYRWNRIDQENPNTKSVGKKRRKLHKRCTWQINPANKPEKMKCSVSKESIQVKEGAAGQRTSHRVSQEQGKYSETSNKNSIETDTAYRIRRLRIVKLGGPAGGGTQSIQNGCGQRPLCWLEHDTTCLQRSAIRKCPKTKQGTHGEAEQPSDHKQDIVFSQSKSEKSHVSP